MTFSFLKAVLIGGPFDNERIHVLCSEAPYEGWGGVLNFPIFETFNVPVDANFGEVSSDGLWAYFPGVSGVQANVKIVMPWKAALARPGTNATREGVAL